MATFRRPGTFAGRSAVFSDWDLYRFGLRLGLRSLPRSLRSALKRIILPVEYIRCAESRYVLHHLDVAEGHTVLDIGSPKLLSLFLAARIGARVHATDLMDYFFADYAVYAECTPGLDPGRYRMSTEDARALSYERESFDRVFSISVIEHIPGDGDSVAVMEIARVLRPGGLCCLTVPWSDRGYLEQFKRRGDPAAYWAEGDGDLVFYQRGYDATTLRRRLVDPAGLELIDLSFWGEARIPVEDCLGSRRIPRVVRWALLPAHFPLNRLFVTRLDERQLSHKKVACITLRKPTARSSSPADVPQE